MPIYGYECSSCGRRLERLQRRDDPPPADCECGGTMRRQVSAPAFQFKGSGWYVTDYAGRKAASDGDSESSASEGKSESGKDEPGKDESGKDGKSAARKNENGGESAKPGKSATGEKGKKGGGKTADQSASKKSGAADNAG